MCPDCSNLNTYFHMKNHYRRLKNVKSLVDSTAPESLQARKHALLKTKENFDNIPQSAASINKTLSTQKSTTSTILPPGQRVNFIKGSSGDFPKDSVEVQIDATYSVNEKEYAHFLLRITEDILTSNKFTPESVQQIIDSHIESNKGRLDTDKMISLTDELKHDLKIAKTNIEQKPQTEARNEDSQTASLTSMKYKFDISKGRSSKLLGKENSDKSKSVDIKATSKNDTPLSDSSRFLLEEGNLDLDLPKTMKTKGPDSPKTSDDYDLLTRPIVNKNLLSVIEDHDESNSSEDGKLELETLTKLEFNSHDNIEKLVQELPQQLKPLEETEFETDLKDTKNSTIIKSEEINNEQLKKHEDEIANETEMFTKQNIGEINTANKPMEDQTRIEIKSFEENEIEMSNQFEEYLKKQLREKIKKELQMDHKNVGTEQVPPTNLYNNETSNYFSGTEEAPFSSKLSFAFLPQVAPVLNYNVDKTNSQQFHTSCFCGRASGPQLAIKLTVENSQEEEYIIVNGPVCLPKNVLTKQCVPVVLDNSNFIPKFVQEEVSPLPSPPPPTTTTTTTTNNMINDNIKVKSRTLSPPLNKLIENDYDLTPQKEKIKSLIPNVEVLSPPVPTINEDKNEIKRSLINEDLYYPEFSLRDSAISSYGDIQIYKQFLDAQKRRFTNQNDEEKKQGPQNLANDLQNEELDTIQALSRQMRIRSPTYELKQEAPQSNQLILRSPTQELLEHKIVINQEEQSSNSTQENTIDASDKDFSAKPGLIKQLDEYEQKIKEIRRNALKQVHSSLDAPNSEDTAVRARSANRSLGININDTRIFPNKNTDESDDSLGEVKGMRSSQPLVKNGRNNLKNKKNSIEYVQNLMD